MRSSIAQLHGASSGTSSTARRRGTPANARSAGCVAAAGRAASVRGRYRSSGQPARRTTPLPPQQSHPLRWLQKMLPAERTDARVRTRAPIGHALAPKQGLRQHRACLAQRIQSHPIDRPLAAAVGSVVCVVPAYLWHKPSFMDRRSHDRSAGCKGSMRRSSPMRHGIRHLSLFVAGQGFAGTHGMKTVWPTRLCWWPFATPIPFTRRALYGRPLLRQVKTTDPGAGAGHWPGSARRSGGWWPVRCACWCWGPIRAADLSYPASAAPTVLNTTEMTMAASVATTLVPPRAVSCCAAVRHRRR